MMTTMMMQDEMDHRKRRSASKPDPDHAMPHTSLEIHVDCENQLLLVLQTKLRRNDVVLCSFA